MSLRLLRLNWLFAALFAAALFAGCETAQKKQEEAALKQEMARVKEKADQKDAAQQELIRSRLAEQGAPGTPPGAHRATTQATSEQEKKPAGTVAGGPAAAAQTSAQGAKKSDTKKGWQKDLVRDLKNYPNNLGEDTLGIFDEDNLLENSLVLGAGLSLAIVSKTTSWDGNVARTFDKHHRFGDATNVADVLGNPGTHFGVAALSYTLGEAYKDQQAADTGRRLFEALAINDLLTLGLEAATDQSRPNGKKMSFPSGHTSSSFALAAVLDGVYGPLVGIPMYGFAGFVGAARLDSRAHHLSDVLFGAALGYVVGRTVTKEDRKRQVLGFQVDPWMDDDSGAGGVQIRKRF